MRLQFLVLLILISGIIPTYAMKYARMPHISAKALELVARVHGVYDHSAGNMPDGKMPDAAVLGNGDLGVMLGGKSDVFGVLKGGRHVDLKDNTAEWEESENPQNLLSK